MSDVPSPARNGLVKPPWETALYVALEKCRDDMDELKRENALLRAELANTNGTLERGRRDARQRHENWKLREQAWKRELDALRARLEERA